MLKRSVCAALLSLLASAETALVQTRNQCKWQTAAVPTSVIGGELRNASEGVTSDGKGTIYFNDDANFWATFVDDSGAFRVRALRKDVIPIEMKRMGYRHMGDTAYHSTVGILAPASGYPNKTVPPRVLALSPTTLLPKKFDCVFANQTLNPWIALQPGSNLLFSSDYDLALRLHVYDPSRSCLHVRSVRLSKALIGVQGGAFLNSSSLFVTADDACVYSIDVATGSVRRELCRLLDFEMEGIFFADLRRHGMGELHFYEGDLWLKHRPRLMFHYECL